MALQKCGLNLNRAYKELQPHGTSDFPCAGYAAYYTDEPNDVIPWHWHEELEVVYIEKGSLKLQLPGKTFFLKQGETFLINSNILHSASACPSCSLHSMVFHSSLVTGAKDSVFAGKYILPLMNCCGLDGRLIPQEANPMAPAPFVTAFQALCSETPGYEFTVREHLSSLCLSLYKLFKPDPDAPGQEPDQDSMRMRQMLDYIHCHFAEDISLAQIAKAADIGERECLRCFQRSIQLSPIQYLLKYRITKASSLLSKSPGLSISEIAAKCGFESPSNFSQTFKRFHNCTPREYRK